jgi:hypothetical protein
MTEESKLKVENLRDANGKCIPLLERWFIYSGKRLYDPKMEYWSVKVTSDYPLLNESVLSTDEAGNELRAMFFVTHKEKPQKRALLFLTDLMESLSNIEEDIPIKKKCKKTELFLLADLFESLSMIEKDISILEVLEIFSEEKPQYARPSLVVCLGALEEEGILYKGCFLFNIPPIDKTELYSEEELHMQTPAEVKKIEETEELY